MKLSELSMDAMLTVRHRDDGNISVMSKEDFLNSAYFLDYPVEPFPKITLAQKSVVRFDLYSVLEMLGEDETYEDWLSNVWYDLKRSQIDLDTFDAEMTRIMEANPTYWEGEPIEVDIEICTEGEPKNHDVSRYRKYR